MISNLLVITLLILFLIIILSIFLINHFLLFLPRSRLGNRGPSPPSQLQIKNKVLLSSFPLLSSPPPYSILLISSSPLLPPSLPRPQSSMIPHPLHPFCPLIFPSRAPGPARACSSSAGPAPGSTTRDSYCGPGMKLGTNLQLEFNCWNTSAGIKLL